MENEGFLLTRLSQGVTAGRHREQCQNRFLLTRLSQGVTVAMVTAAGEAIISTHTPLARRDVHQVFRQFLKSDFYSHASRKA